jgi:hypothetical protein
MYSHVGFLTDGQAGLLVFCIVTFFLATPSIVLEICRFEERSALATALPMLVSALLTGAMLVTFLPVIQ